MDFKDFIEKFADQFEEIDISTLNEDTEYKNLPGWSSLIALMVIAMVDEEYNVKINGNDIRGTKTLKELFDLIRSRC